MRVHTTKYMHWAGRVSSHCVMSMSSSTSLDEMSVTLELKSCTESRRPAMMACQWEVGDKGGGMQREDDQQRLLLRFRHFHSPASAWPCPGPAGTWTRTRPPLP